jgi:hypothetical protein
LEKVKKIFSATLRKDWIQKPILRQLPEKAQNAIITGVLWNLFSPKRVSEFERGEKARMYSPWSTSTPPELKTFSRQLQANPLFLGPTILRTL